MATRKASCRLEAWRVSFLLLWKLALCWLCVYNLHEIGYVVNKMSTNMEHVVCVLSILLLLMLSMCVCIIYFDSHETTTTTTTTTTTSTTTASITKEQQTTKTTTWATCCWCGSQVFIVVTVVLVVVTELCTNGYEHCAGEAEGKHTVVNALFWLPYTCDNWFLTIVLFLVAVAVHYLCWSCYRLWILPVLWRSQLASSLITLVLLLV